MPTGDMSVEAGDQLSELEKEYLSHMVNGTSPAAIAQELNLSSAMADAVRKSLEIKLAVTSSSALVRKGLLAGL
jgi:DNA-binding CsgD family transcriptional regulator